MKRFIFCLALLSAGESRLARASAPRKDIPVLIFSFLIYVPQKCPQKHNSPQWIALWAVQKSELDETKNSSKQTSAHSRANNTDKRNEGENSAYQKS